MNFPTNGSTPARAVNLGMDQLELNGRAAGLLPSGRSPVLFEDKMSITRTRVKSGGERKVALPLNHYNYRLPSGREGNAVRKLMSLWRPVREKRVAGQERYEFLMREAVAARHRGADLDDLLLLTRQLNLRC